MLDAQGRELIVVDENGLPATSATVAEGTALVFAGSGPTQVKAVAGEGGGLSKSGTYVDNALLGADGTAGKVKALNVTADADGSLTLGSGNAVTVTTIDKVAAEGVNVNVVGGDISGSGTHQAGDASLVAGDGAGTNHTGGDAYVTAGAGVAQGGAVSVAAGNSTEGTGGAITATAGNCNSLSSGLAGGAVTVTAGASLSGNGGNISITGGSGVTAGNGGNIAIYGGDGNSIGGDVTISGGDPDGKVSLKSNNIALITVDQANGGIFLGPGGEGVLPVIYRKNVHIDYTDVQIANTLKNIAVLALAAGDIPMYWGFDLTAKFEGAPITTGTLKLTYDGFESADADIHTATAKKSGNFVGRALDGSPELCAGGDITASFNADANWSNLTAGAIDIWIAVMKLSP